MASAPRFRAEQELYRSHRTIVELGERGGRRVVVKRSADPSVSAQRRRAAHEAHLLGLVRSEHVIACYSSDAADGDAREDEGLLVLEHLDGATLAELPLPLSLPMFYEVALDACRALSVVHEAQIIHKDINPSNLVRTRSGVTKLIDFDIATRVPRETGRFRAPSQIEGTLACIAPEQTGRTGRVLDLRADLYSLGATFYWLLSGRPPFEESDPLALLHRHIAERPKSIAGVPAALDRIVQRLLAKNAEDRYQSARGVERDLQRAREGTLDALGLDDVPYRLVLPSRVLGREREARALCAVFDAMHEDGSCKVALVAGYSGVGKTSLVREVHKPLTARAGYFLRGKLDPFDRNTPYAALALALEGHVRVLLSEPAAQLEQYRQRLKSALSTRASELVRGFPALEPLLGPPQASADGAAPVSDPQAMGRLLQRLFGVLASRQHPLVIFFDDLQWADPATLAFIERSAQVGRSMLIVGAYRDNEVGPGHPLRELIARLSRGAAGNSPLALQLTLEPLGLADVTAFVAETLHRAPESVAALARTLHERTGGNPYFLGQTLLALEQEGVIARRGGVWLWDEARASLLAPAEHVADITARRLASAPEATRALLHVMACVGNEIDTAQIEALLGKTSAQAEALVEDALYEGFVTMLEPGRIGFLHDRVRLAAYELGDEAGRRAQHARIAAAYLRDPSSRGQRLFETVTQLQAAFDPARANDDHALSSALIEHSLLAARRAHGAGAFEVSLGYARACREVLAALGRSDSDEYRAATSLYGDAHYSLGNLERALRAYDELLALERDPVRRSAVYRQKAVVKTVEGELGEAYGYFVLLVRELGFDFNVLPTADEAAGMVAWARDVIAEIGLAELEELPRNDESSSEVLIEACSYFGTIAYAFRPESFKAVQSYTLIHCFDFGVPPSAPPMITAWAYCAASIGDYPLALEVARAGCRLAERHSPKAIAERARTLYALLAMHYETGTDEHLLELRACADRCASHGDLEYAGYARNAHDAMLALTQGAVAHVLERVRASRAWASELHVVDSLQAAERTELHLTLLRGAEASGARASLPDAPSIAPAAALHGGAADARDLAFRTAFSVLVGDYAQGALAYARITELRAQLEGSFLLTLAAFYGAVALLMTRRRKRLDAEHTARLASAIAFVGLHAQQNPRASGAYAELLAALAAAEEASDGAIGQLERAIEGARLGSAPVLAALGAALAAEHAMERGQLRVAHSFAEQACREYVELGMFAAVRALQRNFARVGLRPSAQLPLQLEGTATGIDPRSLDLWSALRASQALAAELHVEPLISRLLGLAREAAGAQRVVLVSHAQLGEGGSERVLSVVAELDAGVQIDVGEPLAQSARVPVPLIERAIRAGDVRVIHDATRDAEWSDLPYFKQSGARSALCVPIGQGGTASGALYLENALAAGAFDAGRVEVLRILASQAAVSLQNAQLLREEAEKERLHREMETAAHIQRALVPIAPRIGGFEIAVQMTPADKVGGDYYDVLHADGADWFVVGDVSGHGLPAGLVMIICQTALHAVLQGQPDIDPAHALSQVNRLLNQSLARFQETKYVAITLFKHVGEGVIEYAGLHEDLVIYRKATAEVEVQQSSGTWLGVVPDLLPLIPLCRIQLQPGDVLALYTDGVIDARAGDGSKWGQAGLVKLLRDCGGLPLETIKARVLGALAKLRQTDDVTLFLLRR